MENELQHITQNSTLAPAQPAYVLRGHSAQIHAVHFLRQNLRLLSGDADGWVVLWSIPIKRPVTVWRAHNATILGLGSWEDDKIITHGRDNKLHVWQLEEENETNFSTKLPIDDIVSERKQPWLLHSLVVHALNFCSFTMCAKPMTNATSNEDPRKTSILIATPGVQDGQVNVTSLPGEERIATIPSPKAINTGMVMAIGLHYHMDKLFVLAGYESGHVAVWQKNDTKHWETTYVSKSHSQPVLSLDIASLLDCVITSSVDAVIAKHPFRGETSGTKKVQTKHAGQQSLTVRSDEKVFATAGWDGRMRVYSAKSMKELAVLKWHKEGCYALAFANVSEPYSSSDGNGAEGDGSLAKRDLTVSEQRTEKAKQIHWLAAGSKDGKISLWDVY